MLRADMVPWVACQAAVCCWQKLQQSCEWSIWAAFGDGACSRSGDTIRKTLDQGNSICAAVQWHEGCQKRAGLVPRLDKKQRCLFSFAKP